MNFKQILFVIILFQSFLLSCNGTLRYDFQDDIYSESIDSVFRFIHISDTHGSTVSIDAVNEYCQKHACDFILLTGDVVPNEKLVKSVLSSPIDYLVIPGNHDSYGPEGLGQFGFREQFQNLIENNVIFSDNSTNYWYKDYEKKGKKLRVIGLDQFEFDSFGRKHGYFDMMTQEQIDWFIKLLEESYEFDGIVILIHMGFGNKNKGQRDTSNHNEFISGLSSLFDNSYDYYGPEDPYMIPDIIDAYSTGNNINIVYNRGKDYAINVITHFEGKHNNFVGYFGGHLHWDEIEYLVDFPYQLQCLIAYCGNGIGSNLNDLTKKDYPFLFNIVDIDFYSGNLRILRRGASITSFGTHRQTIAFPLNKD